MYRVPHVGTPEKYPTSTGERRSRIHGPQMERESGDGMDADDLAASERKLSFSNLGLQAENLQSFYDSENKESADTQSEMCVNAKQY